MAVKVRIIIHSFEFRLTDSAPFFSVTGTGSVAVPEPRFFLAGAEAEIVCSATALAIFELDGLAILMTNGEKFNKTKTNSVQLTHVFYSFTFSSHSITIHGQRCSRPMRNITFYRRKFFGLAPTKIGSATLATGTI